MGRWLSAVGGLFLLFGLGVYLGDPGLGAVLRLPLLLSGGVSLVLGSLLLWRPGRLLLSPQGLVLETFILRRRGSWTWQQVSAFRLDKVWAGRQRVALIRFTSTEAGQERAQALPTYWQRPGQEVINLLNDLRNRQRDGSQR